jgi:hypothetical protein
VVARSVLRLVPLGVAMLGFTRSAEAQARPKNVKVRHCAAADSALGKKSRAWRGALVSSVDAEGVTHVRGAPTKELYSVIGSARVEGRIWAEVPPLALSVFLRGSGVDALVGLGREPSVTVIVDDTVPLVPAAVKLGKFVAPDNVPKSLITMPVSALINPSDFLTLARARSAYVKVEQAKVLPVGAELQNIQALYAVLTCGRLD